MEEEIPLNIYEIIREKNSLFVRGHFIRVNENDTLIIRYNLQEIDPEVIVAVVDKGSIVVRVRN